LLSSGESGGKSGDFPPGGIEEDLSRIGKKPIEVPAAVSVAISPGRVQVNGPLGELSQNVPQRMQIEQRDGELVVTRPTDRGEDRALHGLTRTLIANMVEGVTKGFERRLEIQGVGYRAALRGTSLELNVGYSHSVVIEPRRGITFEVPQPTVVVVRGTDKQAVGQQAADIRRVRPPEPYKGKGIRYEGEYVRRKVGKRA
jgi:large subunit ribosomal protein L6